MKSFSNYIVILCLVVLLFGYGFIQPGFKNDFQLLMIGFGFLVFISLFAKPPYKTNIPFYLLLGFLIFVNIFQATNFILHATVPDDGWITDADGTKHRVMQLQWMWGVLTGIIITPFIIIYYHKKVHRNHRLELVFTSLFVIIATINYFLK